MNTLTRDFLRSKFREYYLQEPLEFPPGLESREWGFILFDEVGMRRHKSYVSRGELVDYIRSMVPAHLYHSAAYYQRPGAPTMKEKGWQGADLIFDLDADHLRKAPKSYREMLNLVKKETLKLLGFLMTDFGISEKNMSIVFSGGRGYHIHVRDPKVLNLGSDERREIVDYLTGTGLDTEKLTFKVVVSGDVGKERVRALRCSPEDAAGWGSKFNQAVLLFAEEIRSLDEITAIKRLMEIKGIGKARATDFYQKLIGNNTVIGDLRTGNLDSLKGIQNIWPYVIDNYLANQFVQILGGETDEPVTADIRRLIRCPTSLHGGSGFRVTPLSISSLEEFEPLWDAIVFGDEPVQIDMQKPFNTEIRGQGFNLEEGHSELPAYAAIFLMARGLAELGAKL